MKKIALSILAAGLAALTLASCGGDGDTTTDAPAGSTPAASTSEATTQAPETTAPATSDDAAETTAEPEVTTAEPETTTAEPEVTTEEPETTTATEPQVTTEPEVTTTETPEPATPDVPDNLYYAIDVDITIVDGNAGIVFAGANDSNFVMWQLAIGEYSDGILYLRPHVWQNGGGRCVEEIYLNEDVKGLENVSAEYNVQHHMTIRVFNDGLVETLIDGISCGTTDAVAGMILTDTLGMVGFRCDAYNNGTIPEVGLYDNLKITDGTGAVIYEDDFSDENSTLCGALVDGNQVVLENGALKITGRYVNMAEVA